LSDSDFVIDIEEILGEGNHPQFIPIEQCVTGSSQMRQSGTVVNKDDKLVDQIRRTQGIFHPIIVKSLPDNTYEIIVGQRRTGAYHILKEEDSKYEKIKAYVISRDLSEDEKKVISFIENFGRDDAEHTDYVNVIEYFYQKYNQNKTQTASALGISVPSVTKYLTHARLSDSVKECIKNKDFTIDVAMKALKGLGDDENSVDDDILIETSKELAKLRPAVRKKTVKTMEHKQIPVSEAAEAVKALHEIKIEFTDDILDKLSTYKTKHGYSDESEAAFAAVDTELTRDLE